MRKLISLLILCSLLGACGYKGALYMPEPEKDNTPSESEATEGSQGKQTPSEEPKH